MGKYQVDTKRQSSEDKAEESGSESESSADETEESESVRDICMYFGLLFINCFVFEFVRRQIESSEDKQ